MGSDHGPAVPIQAVVMAAGELGADVHLVLIGHAETIRSGLLEAGADPDAFTIVPSENDITFNDNATKAFQAKPKSSISIGFHLLKEGKVDAFASTGNTGAMLVGSIFSVKPIPGVIRPCIPSVVPKENGTYGILVDVGANADCKADVLAQFGMLGAMLDDLCASLVDATLQSGERVATLNLNLCFLRPARPGPLQGEANLVRRGRDVCHVEATLSQNGKPVASATATCLIAR